MRRHAFITGGNVTAYHRDASTSGHEGHSRTTWVLHVDAMSAVPMDATEFKSPPGRDSLNGVGSRPQRAIASSASKRKSKFFGNRKVKDYANRSRTTSARVTAASVSVSSRPSWGKVKRV